MDNISNQGFLKEVMRPEEHGSQCGSSITRSFINAIIYVCRVSLNIISRADNCGFALEFEAIAISRNGV